ncbi:MAG: EpsI family protein [Planctomycetia bacterium]|nr:EpsI family protein [Planctomycetia bacterium]
MKTSTSGLLTLAGATLLVVGVTVVQGLWTERWKDRRVSKELENAATLLEKTFPESFGNWSMERDLEGDAKELERAGAVGHISRLYRNKRTKARVSAFVVCARPHDASGHTPDRCYPGAGFEIGEAEHRQTIPLPDGRLAETFTGTFRKTGQTLRIFWTYGIRDAASIEKEDVATRRAWIAPQIARIALAGEPAVYKLYAIVDETRLSSTQSMVECEDFLANLLPALDAAMAGKENAPGPASDGAPPAADETTPRPQETAGPVG